MGIDSREDQQADPEHRHTHGDDPARPEAHGDTSRDHRPDDHERTHRREPQARLDGRVVQHRLHVERDEEPHREGGGAEEEDHDVRARQRARAEDAQRHERTAGQPALDQDEDGEQNEPDRHRYERLQRAPAVHVRAHDRVRQEHEPGRERGRAREVVVTRARALARVVDEAERPDPGGYADRHVDQEDRAPAEDLGQDAAQQHASRSAHTTHRAPGSQRAVARRAFGERVGEDRQGHGRDNRAAQPLDAASDDQHELVVRQRADQRGEGEGRKAGNEHAPVAQQVRGAAAEHQEPGQRERVGVDDPLQVDQREAQIAPDRRQRDVHDRDVQHDHELRDAAEQKNPARAGHTRKLLAGV